MRMCRYVFSLHQFKQHITAPTVTYLTAKYTTRSRVVPAGQQVYTIRGISPHNSSSSWQHPRTSSGDWLDGATHRMCFALRQGGKKRQHTTHSLTEHRTCEEAGFIVLIGLLPDSADRAGVTARSPPLCLSPPPPSARPAPGRPRRPTCTLPSALSSCLSPL